MCPSTGGHSLDLSKTAYLKPISYDAAHIALWNGLAQVGGAVEAETACEGGAVESQEFIAISNAPWVLFCDLVSSTLYGVSVVFEFSYGLLGVVNLKDPVYLAHWRFFLEPT